MDFVMLLWVFVLLALFLVYFHMLTQEIVRVKRERSTYYMAVMREHRRWHPCVGGLGVDENGAITHFNPNGGLDEDS